MQASTSQTTSPTTPGTTPAVVNPDAVPHPTILWEAARATRKELRDQQDALVANRHQYLREIEDHEEVGGPATIGMQQRITQLDQRIAELDKQIAAADAQVARAASVPGAVTIEPPPPFEGPPEIVYVGGTFVMLALVVPISIAFARRIWRRSSAQVQQLPRDLMERLARLEQIGESTAIEVERIGEGQRFVTKVLNERSERAIGERAEVQP